MSDNDRRGPEWFEEPEEFTEDDMKRVARTFWILIAALATVLALAVWGIYEAIT